MTALIPMLARLLARTAFVLTCLVLAVRILAPPGFMIAPTAQTGAMSPIVLCSGHGPVTRFIAADGRLVDGPAHNPKDDGETRHGAHCGFSATATGPLPPSALGVARCVVIGATDKTPPPTGLRPGLGLCAPPPPATGPPLTL